jgi:RecA/RadA recombinase
VLKRPTATGYAPVDDSSQRQSSLVCLADVEPKEITWLWPPYAPRGKITLIRGDPGQGKTTFCLTIAAIVSQGWAFPTDSGFVASEPGNVLFITAEDDLSDTIVPRLIKAKADMSRVFSYREESREQLTFISSQFEGLLKESAPSLVIIDPIQAFLGSKVDGHRANEVRPIMSHLRTLAERYNCAMLLIEHLNKNIGGKGIYRGLGSIDITAAARSILMLGSDPDNEQDRGIAHIKSNCGAMGKVVGFSISENGLVWNPHTTLTVDMIQGHVKPQTDSGDSAIDEAKEFLLDVLADERQIAKDVSIMAKQYDISEKTLRRAREGLGVLTKREGFGKGSVVYWELPFMQDAKLLAPAARQEIEKMF